MRCPTLNELPDPPVGRTGWPWTEESSQAPFDPEQTRRITVVTPSYNQGEFLEETIRSVLLQGHPDLEYLVLDGGSTDNSVEIIRKYERWISFWSSARDGGQSDAINQGLRRGTGEIMAWLNSDDIYMPGALHAVTEAMPRTSRAILLGVTDKAEIVGSQSRFVKRSTPTTGRPMHSVLLLNNGYRASFHFIQPSMFWTRGVWEAAGELDERYHYVMDVEWCNRALARGAQIATTEAVLARFAMHPAAKTQHYLPRALQEHALMYWRLSRSPDFRRFPCLLASLYPLEKSLAKRAQRIRHEGREMTATLLRLGALAVRFCRSALVGIGRGLGMRVYTQAG